MNSNIERPERPLVSIIIPTYNCRRWVTMAIDSALAQSYPNCQIIVIDDGSNDGTGTLLKERYGDRINYIYQDNRGRSAARNRGIKEAQGKYLQFLDADDLIMPGKIARQVEFLEANQDVDVVYGDVLLFYEDEINNRWEHEKRKYYASGDDLLAKMLHEPFLLPVHALHRTRCVKTVGGFDESIRRVEDWDFHLRLAKAGARFNYLKDGGESLYRQRYFTMPEERILAATEAIRVVRKIRSGMDSSEARKLRIRRAEAMARFTYGSELMKSGRKAKGMAQYLLSLGSPDDRLPVRASYFFLSLFLPPSRVERVVSLLVGMKGICVRNVRVKRGAGGYEDRG